MYALACAHGDRRLLRKALNPRKLSYRKGANIKHLSCFAPLLALADAYDESLPAHVQIEMIFSAARGVLAVKDVFLRSIILLGVIRALSEHDLPEALDLLIEMYKRDSRRLSKGRTDDIVGLGGDIIYGLLDWPKPHSN